MTRKVIFSNPQDTMAVSITGKGCGLKCSHCDKKALFGMRNISDALSSNKKSFLVSGGSRPNGSVPISKKFLSMLRERDPTTEIIQHVGVITEREAQLLSEHVDCVSFDLVGDTETVKEVYHHDKQFEEYEQSYLLLKKYVRVVPHICIGLRRGKLSGEFNALDMLKRHGCDEITFIVFMPIPGTPYADVAPPAQEDVKKVLEYARAHFPHAKINLGCMRPKRLYDELAIEAGVDCIVHPSPSAQKLCSDKGHTVEKKGGCCMLC